MKISIIGGAGHVGLPLGLVLADADHSVTLIDEDEERLATLSDGRLPFQEPGGRELLQTGLETGKIELSTDFDSVAAAEAVIIVIGTPIDEHHNPQVEPLLDLIAELTPHFTDDQLLLLRSTVYPGTTAIVRDELAEAKYVDGENFHIAFTPERTAQHNAIEEVASLPQLIGAFCDSSYDRACDLFGTFVEADLLRLQPAEAELGKLFTNMWRYLLFAAANEFYLITESFAEHHDLNVHRILDQTAKDYPRFDVPSPGANVGGPCLTKDGWYLVDNIPFNDLVSAAYQINEGMPAQIIDRMSQLSPDPETIAILGMTFKSGSDDTRNSVAFKMEKQLQMKGYSDVVRVDPNVADEFDDPASIRGADWVILMTPHAEFDLTSIRDLVATDDCLYCDIWGHWTEMKYTSDNGYFFGHELSNETHTPVGLKHDGR